MFHQNMSLSGDDVQEMGNDHQTVTPVHIQQQITPVKYSISQHYTHSSHVAHTLHPLQPPKQDVATRALIKNGITPSSLLRSQLALFEGADEDQRNRLIELWRIVPPNYAGNGGQELADKLGEYQSTTLAQEEELARIRYLSEVRAANASSRRSEGILQPAFGYHPSAAPRQSVEGNEYLSRFDGQQIHYAPGLPSQPSAATTDDVDEEML
ncbi:hypothetical protein P7C71_g4077, partial [Lecanoromycetidae sp. Uapishka_2]